MDWRVRLKALAIVSVFGFPISLLPRWLIIDIGIWAGVALGVLAFTFISLIVILHDDLGHVE